MYSLSLLKVVLLDLGFDFLINVFTVFVAVLAYFDSRT